jgi:DNA-binding transcriptional MerR regulator
LIHSPLFDEIRAYLTRAKYDEQIFLFVPYIKTKILEKLLDGIQNKITIITTWHINDLIAKSSELELYDFCKKGGIFLYINNEIHLKVYSVNLNTGIVTSGNISNSGLMPNGNFEAGILSGKFSNQDRLYLEKIITDAEFVDEKVFQKYLQKYNECKEKAHPQNEFDDPIITAKKDDFQISALPMTKNVDELIEGYVKINSDLKPSENQETADCIYHDIVNYKIESGLSKEEFIEKLKTQFFAHPFTKKIDEFINPEAYFGRIKEWIQNNCTTVPIPSRRELTENVQVLYDWFAKLGDGKYIVDTPNYSQRIRKIETYSKENSDYTKINENEVLRILASTGYSIKEIEEVYDKTEHKKSKLDNPSDPLELENESKPIWHYKIELNKKFEKIISENQNKVLDSLEQKKIHKNIAYIIGRLEKEEFIVFWIHISKQYSPGIWRLSDKGKQEVQRRGISNIIESHKENKLENSRLVLFSVSGDASFEHFENTILKDVETVDFPTSDMKKLPKVRMWGAIDRATNNNRSKWSKLKKGDILLFYRDKKYVTRMIISGTEDNYDVAKMIWGEKIDHETMNVESKSGETWQLIMYAEPENIKQMDIKMEDLNNLLGYKENFMPTRTLDFTSVNELKLQQLQNQHGSIQNALDTINF